MYDLIIIGSGPAGLSAAVYGKRAGLNLLIIEEKPMSGGQILNTYEVDNYLGLPGISGFDMGMTFRQHAEKLGAEFLEATVHSVEERGDYKCVYAGNQELETRTVIFATGAEHARLGVPGEEELNGMGVLPVTVPFSGAERWLWSAAVTWHWKMPSIWQEPAKRCI